jgi:hypothetical protein
MRSLMTSILRHLVVMLLATAVPGGAFAQGAPRCPEGRTASGACVNADLAQDMRTTTLVLSQPKLSLTNPPVLPSQDGQYDLPRDHHELRNLHGYPPVTSATGRTVSFPGLCAAVPCTITVNTGPSP